MAHLPWTSFDRIVERYAGEYRARTLSCREHFRALVFAQLRDWRIYADFAQVLIAQARRLYASEPGVLDVEETVYALDSTTIDLCLSSFPWAVFRRAKAAVKLHTLMDLRGSIPSFIHVSDGKMHD